MDQFDPVADVEDFHDKFGLRYDGFPRSLPPTLGMFREKFLREELHEYADSLALEDQLDALVDLVYVALGTAHLHGFDFREAWRRVHQANMRKVRSREPTSSDRGGGYDVVKPPGWEPPDLSDLVRMAGTHGFFTLDAGDASELTDEQRAARVSPPVTLLGTHGSPELDADAEKLRALGQDDGPTIEDLEEL